MAVVAPVFTIRDITDNDEIIMGISASVYGDNSCIAVYNAGYAIISLKSGDINYQTGVPYIVNDNDAFNKKVEKFLVDLCEFMQRQRGYYDKQ